MLLKILIVGVAAMASLVLVKEKDVLRRAQIVGSCQVVAPPHGTAFTKGQWWMCTEGKLTGFPTLDRGACDRQGLYRKQEVWYCSSPVAQPY